MSKHIDEILGLLAHIPSEEKNSVKKLFDSLLKVAIRSESGYGYKDGVTGYTNGIYLAYLKTFYASKNKKLELVAQLRTGRVITEAIDKNILLVSAMNDDEKNEAKNIWKNIAIGTMKNLGNGYRYGTAYAINHRVLNYLELYCGVNMSKSPREVFQMPGFDLKIGA